MCILCQQTSPKTLVWKQHYDVNFVTSQTAHTKYK